MNGSYKVSLEIAGPVAMFTRPDTGAAQVSYPAPTYSAAKGIFESIVRFKSAYIKPVKVEICKPIKYQKYVTNYGGPLRKDSQISKGASYQLSALVLIDVCYRLFGVIEEISKAPKGNNHLHALQEIFNRRLQKGQFFYTPCLGWKEFVPSYLGPFREGTKKEETIKKVIPAMLYWVFDKPSHGRINPKFDNGIDGQGVRIEEGVLKYVE